MNEETNNKDKVVEVNVAQCAGASGLIGLVVVGGIIIKKQLNKRAEAKRKTEEELKELKSDVKELTLMIAELHDKINKKLEENDEEKEEKEE